MANSADEKTTKCFSGILRRFLCTGSLPTHPSDQFLDPNMKQVDQKMEDIVNLDVEVEQAAKPGVVARLMGLDSFPATPLAQKDRTLGYYLRSRSVNSIDFVDLAKTGHHKHRRVRTSVSFREGLDDRYSLVLQKIEEVDESKGYEENLFIGERENQQVKKEKRIKSRKCEKSEKKNGIQKPHKLCAGVKNARYDEKKCHGKRRVNLRDTRLSIKQEDSEKALIGSKSVKTRPNGARIQNRNIQQKTWAHKVHLDRSGKKRSHLEKRPEVARGNNTRTKFASQIANSQSEAHYYNNEELRAVIEANTGTKATNINDDDEKCYYERMADEIYQVTKEDLIENLIHWKYEDFEEIWQLFEHEILEMLLTQLVDEFVLIRV